ncbi:MAG: hypothetical protein AVDCRST_MAG53-909, partial [uncultured Solirubrobacteraceae bacterium]
GQACRSCTGTPAAHGKPRGRRRPLRGAGRALRHGGTAPACRGVHARRSVHQRRQLPPSGEDEPALTALVAGGRALRRQAGRIALPDQRGRHPMAREVDLRARPVRGAQPRPRGAAGRQGLRRRRVRGALRQGRRGARDRGGGSVDGASGAAGRRSAGRAAAAGDDRAECAQGRRREVLPHRSGRQGPHDVPPPGERQVRAAAERLLRHAERRPRDPAASAARAALHPAVPERAVQERRGARHHRRLDELRPAGRGRPAPVPLGGHLVPDHHQRLRGGDDQAGL